MLEYALLIPMFPFLAAVMLQFTERRLGKRSSNIAIAAMTISFILSIVVLGQVVAYNAAHEEIQGPLMDLKIRWLTVFNTDIEFGIMVDNLTALMLVVVTLVALLIQIYSLGYMDKDPLFGRYYKYLSLFTFSMLALILSNNLLQLFIFWELVGLCSYLLIGFWFEKDGPQHAQKKAFLVTKAGDLAFMLGVFLVFFVFGTFNFEAIFSQLPTILQSTDSFLGLSGGVVITVIALFIFIGAMGKSAQFPLHIWLPNAMEGPTPVSALIHAATMVVAGVYLIGRMYPLIASSAVVMLVIAIIGTITLFMAATIALTVFDIKKVLAYSTISQLGYMMLALGAGSLTAGMFHLMTHAFFKALLFLCAGSVIHSVGTQDLREMGGLKKYMPITFGAMFIAALAISGIPPFAGFWSKDEILLTVFHYNKVLFVVALFAAFLTALYMFRLIYLCFFGMPRGKGHPHESPRSMTWPLIALAALSVVIGLVGAPLPVIGNLFAGFIRSDTHHSASLLLMLISAVVGISGIVIAYLAYFRKVLSPEVFTNAIKPVYLLVKNKYYVDEVVNAVVVNGSLLVATFLSWFDRYVIDALVNFVAAIGRFASRLSQLFDTYVVDGLVNLFGKATRLISMVSGAVDIYIVDGAVNMVGWFTKGFGTALRATQTGQVQTYVTMVFVGIVLVFLFIFSMAR